MVRVKLQIASGQRRFFFDRAIKPGRLAWRRSIDNTGREHDFMRVMSECAPLVLDSRLLRRFMVPRLPRQRASAPACFKWRDVGQVIREFHVNAIFGHGVNRVACACRERTVSMAAARQKKCSAPFTRVAEHMCRHDYRDLLYRRRCIGCNRA